MDLPANSPDDPRPNGDSLSPGNGHPPRPTTVSSSPRMASGGGRAMAGHLGWTIGAGLIALSAVVNAVVLVRHMLAVRANPPTDLGVQSAVVTATCWQIVAIPVQLALSLGVLYRSPMAKWSWVVLACLGSIVLAGAAAAPNARPAPGGRVLVCAVALLYPASWLVLLDRGSARRVALGALLAVASLLGVAYVTHAVR